MESGALRRIASVIAIAAGWLLAGVRLILDLIGYSTVPQDLPVAEGLLKRFLVWLMELPWYVPWGFALISTVWLTYVSWPRAPYAATAPDNVKTTKRHCPEKAERGILKALDDLFAEGVRHKNRLIPPVENYDDAAERSTLHGWQERVLVKMDEVEVPISLMSRFRTFNEFGAQYRPAVDKSNQQNLLEGIWNEKLRQLRIIINGLDKPRAEAES